VLGALFAILTVVIVPKAGTGIARVDGFEGLDQLGAFVLFSSITASFVIAWALYASDYSRYLPPTASRLRIFWWTVLGLTLSAGWIELLGLLVADQAKIAASLGSPT
jgi:NCS1 family nucleobase:cation symporter-1